MPRAKRSSKSKPEHQQRPHELSHASASKAEQSQQKTISDLFSASKQGLSGRAADELPGSSPHKRLKTAHGSDQPTNVPHIEPSEMYNFAPSTPRKSKNIIDLTSSPNTSPLKKKLGGGLARPSTVGSHTGSKKLVVRNLKTVSKPDPDAYFDRVWAQLEAALTAIFSGNQLPYSLEELYKGVEFTTRQDRGPKLFPKLQAKCESCIRTNYEQPLLLTVESKSDVETLSSVVSDWSRWTGQLSTVHSIFYYLDRAYLLNSTQLPSLRDMSTSQFRDHICLNPSLQSKIFQGACQLVDLERTGQQTPQTHQLISNAIIMFHSLAVYTKHFEQILLTSSLNFFNDWAEQTEGSNDLTGYVQMSRKFMAAEAERSDTIGLEQTTGKTLQTYLEDILINQRQARLTQEKDVETLLAEDREDVLKELFKLLERRYIGKTLRQPWEAYIKMAGSAIVFDEENEQNMVPRLLDFKNKLDRILEQCFQKHELLGHTLRDSFENFINKPKRSNMTWGTDNPKPGEMIAKYVDAILKGGAKAARVSAVGGEEPPKAAKEEEGADSAEEDIEITRSLDQVLELFRFVHGKAVFEAFYKRDLARRLLLSRSASRDAEKSMLVRLKSECGAGFTQNLEQMFKDIATGKGEIDSYKKSLDDQGRQLSFDLNVHVLSSSAWPSYPNVQVNVPESILLATAGFEAQYKTKHTGRKLEWKHALAHCQLKATFPKGSKEIVVSSFQAIVLLAFNSNDKLSYTDLQEISGLDDNELQRTLQSLACARYRILSKTPKGKDVSKADIFSINTSFSYPKYRIKINSIQARETKAENKETHERVALDREFETQAAIVRIMKSRKKITHAELVAEVIQQTKTRGVLDVKDIKRNIEKLVEKDYMERDEEGRNVYLYVA